MRDCLAVENFYSSCNFLLFLNPKGLFSMWPLNEVLNRFLPRQTAHISSLAVCAAQAFFAQ